MPRRKQPLTRDEAKRATRGALIAAGLSEFDRHGLDASLDSICDRAGLTRGAFYVHFADRDAFVVAVMQEVLGGFVAALASLSSRDGGIAEMIGMYVAASEARLPAITGGSALRMQHLMEACRRSKTVGGAYRDLMVTARERLSEAIVVDQAARRIRGDVDAEALAELMVIVGLGFAARHELEIPIEIARVAGVLLAICERPRAQGRRTRG